MHSTGFRNTKEKRNRSILSAPKTKPTMAKYNRDPQKCNNFHSEQDFSRYLRAVMSILRSVLIRFNNKRKVSCSVQVLYHPQFIKVSVPIFICFTTKPCFQTGIRFSVLKSLLVIKHQYTTFSIILSQQRLNQRVRMGNSALDASNGKNTLLQTQT